MKTWQAALLTAGVLASTAAHSYQVSGSKWEDGKFRLYVGIPATVPSVDFDGNPITWNGIIQQAAAVWDSPLAGLDIEIIPEAKDPCAGYTGDAEDVVDDAAITNPGTPSRSSTPGFENGIALRADVCSSQFGQDVYAVTLLQTRPGQPGFYREADIIFNQNYQFDSHNNGFSSPSVPGSTETPLDARRIAIKQLGFALGLSEETNLPSIMHPDAATRSITSPTADDLAGMRILYPTPSNGNDPAIRVGVEEPNDSQIKSGISNIRGWAIGLKDIRLVEVSIDNGTYQQIPYGSSRSDVADVFSQYPKAGNSGFSMAFNWGLLSPGQHQVRVRAFDTDDRQFTVTRNVTVARFNDSYVNNVSVNGTSSITNEETVTLNKVIADERSYTVKLEWDNAAQKFNIVSAQND